MAKKLLAVVLAVVTMLSLTACDFHFTLGDFKSSDTDKIKRALADPERVPQRGLQAQYSKRCFRTN